MKEHNHFSKKGFYFTLDALMAFVLLVVVIVLLPYSSLQKTSEYYKTSYLQEDALQVFSGVKTMDVNNENINDIIYNAAYNETLNRDDFLIESVSKLWAVNGTIEGKDSANDARIIASDFFGDVFDERDNIGLFFSNGSSRELIFSENESPYQNGERYVIGATNFISGLSKGKAVKGNTARAFLRRKESTRFVYFGGYIGDGNITSIVDLAGMTNISNVTLEIAINHDFDFYINGEYIGSYSGSSDSLVPVSVYIPEEKFMYFLNGTNMIEFKSPEIRLAISGGYIKIDYRTDEPEYNAIKTQYLPQIKGVINEYDSIYAPNTIESMTLRLHYGINVEEYQNATIFFRLGNATLYSNTSVGPVTDFIKVISSDEIKTILNGSFDSVSNKTVPIRLGFEEFGEGLQAGNADVILITDMSESMNWTMVNESNGTVRDCEDELLYENTTQRLSLAKCLDKKFIDIVLSVPGNRVGLSAFYSEPIKKNSRGLVYQEDLTNNSAYLWGKIQDYITQGGTCLCCAINDAYKILNEQSNWSKKKYVVVMSDGIPTHQCGESGKDECKGDRYGISPREGLWQGGKCYGGVDNCDTADCECSRNNSNWSSCRVHNVLGATVYSIGFGPVAGCEMANGTLRDVADCGGGKYYSSSNATELEEIYKNISQEIVGLSYVEQQINVSGNFDSILYNDSYISYDYDDESDGDLLGKFGSVVTYESDNFENSLADFEFSSGVPLEAIITSYSGIRWTKYALINNTEKTGGSFAKVFNLSDFGTNYNILGDPFRVNIPVSLIAANESNNVLMRIGNATYERNASDSDKIIYALLIQSNYSYSKVVPRAQGCNWTVEYYKGDDNFVVPENYTGSNRCYYNSTIENEDFKCATTNNGNEPLENDAIVQATYYLLRENFDKNPDDCRLDIKVSDYYLNTMLLPSVPFLYYSKAEFLSWR